MAGLKQEIGNVVYHEGLQGRTIANMGGGNGGSTVDAEIKTYVDLKTEATRAQNDAKFAEVIAKIDGFPNPLTWQQAAAVMATGIGIVLAILSFSADRFDGGMSASTDGAVAKELIQQQSKDIEKLINAQSVENQKMIDALAEHHEGQKGFETPK